MPIMFAKILIFPILLLSVGVIVSTIVNPKEAFEDVLGVLIVIASVLSVGTSFMCLFTSITVPTIYLCFILFILSGIGLILNLKSFISLAILQKTLTSPTFMMNCYRDMKTILTGIFLYGYIMFTYGLWAFKIL